MLGEGEREKEEVTTLLNASFILTLTFDGVSQCSSVFLYLFQAEEFTSSI